jgi:tRNA(fMet)-specific endonuclease VapC
VIVPFDAAAATAYGPIQRASKERKKDLMDKLIAAHAVALRVAVVTNNIDDFKVYPDVKIENWVEAN